MILIILDIIMMALAIVKLVIGAGDLTDWCLLIWVLIALLAHIKLKEEDLL